MRSPLILASLAFFLFAACPVKAGVIPALVITVEIDKTKHGGFQWDHNPAGMAPDPHGSITIPGHKREIPAQENTYTLTCTFRDVQMETGDPIIFDLADRDRGRPDDEIARGSITWNGKERSTYRLGFATITVLIRNAEKIPATGETL